MGVSASHPTRAMLRPPTSVVLGLALNAAADASCASPYPLEALEQPGP